MTSMSAPGKAGVRASKLTLPAVQRMARELVDRKSKAAADEAGVLRVNFGASVMAVEAVVVLKVGAVVAIVVAAAVVVAVVVAVAVVAALLPLVVSLLFVSLLSPPFATAAAVAFCTNDDGSPVGAVASVLPPLRLAYSLLLWARSKLIARKRCKCA